MVNYVRTCALCERTVLQAIYVDMDLSASDYEHQRERWGRHEGAA